MREKLRQARLALAVNASPWAWGALWLLVLGLYAPATRFHFLNFDDPALLTAHPWYLAPSGAALGRMLDPRSLWNGQSLDYSPLRDLSYALDRWLWGWSSGAFHRVQVLLHLANASLVLLLLRRRLPLFFAWSGAALWAVHPLGVEPVAWISSRKDLLMSAGCVGALLLEERGKTLRAGACGAAALLCKYAAIFLAPLLLLIAWLQKRRPRWGLIAFLAVASLALGGLAVAANRHLGRLHEVSWFGGEAALWPAAWQVVVHNLRTLLWPFDLAAIYLPQRALVDGSSAAVWGGALLAVAWLEALLGTWSRWPEVALGLLILGLGQLPIAIQIASGHPLWMADRYLYVPLVGAALAVAALAERWGRGRWRRPVQGTLLLLIAALAWQSAQRLPLWRDSLALWQATAGHGSARYEPVAWGNLGLAQMEAEQYPAAILSLQRSLAIDPTWSALWPNLALAMLRTGRAAEAEPLMRRWEAGATAEALAETVLERAMVWGELGEAEKAAAGFSRALAQRPFDPQAWHALAADLARCGRLAEAKQAWERGLRLRPDFYPARLGRARFLVRAGDCPGAAADLQALRDAPPFYLALTAELEQKCPRP